MWRATHPPCAPSLCGRVLQDSAPSLNPSALRLQAPPVSWLLLPQRRIISTPSCRLLPSAQAVASFPQHRPSEYFSVPSSPTSLHPMLSSPLHLQLCSLGLTSISLLILTSQSFVSWTIFSDSSDFISSPALTVLVSLGLPCSGRWSSLPTFPPVIPSPRVTSHHGLQLPVMYFQPRPQIHADVPT